LTLGIVGSYAADQARLSEPSASAAPLASASPPSRLRSFKERLAAAESVKVETKLLGLELDATLEYAHQILDPLADPKQPATEAKEEGEQGEKERKILWKLVRSDFRSILIRTDDQEKVSYMMGFLRPGKERPFDQIGETEKAPVLTERTAAWDVVRPDKSLLRVVARGEKGAANTITIFVVKRSP